MKTTRDLYRTLFLAVVVMLAGGAEIANAAQKPNIVFILADDLGYGDLACFGGKGVKTPNIDSLARDGLKLTSFYVHQRCSPSRLAFMTGSYAHRVGSTKVIYPRDRIGINPEEITTPELLKKNVIMAGSTIRQGDWKLFLKAEKPGGKANQDGRTTPAGSLYNVTSDPGETTDVSAAHPEVVQHLRAAAEAFGKEHSAHSRPIGRLEGDEKDKAVPKAKMQKATTKKKRTT